MVFQIHFPNHHYKFSPLCYYLTYFIRYLFPTDQSCISGPNANSSCFTQIGKYLWKNTRERISVALMGVRRLQILETEDMWTQSVESYWVPLSLQFRDSVKPLKCVAWLWFSPLLMLPCNRNPAPFLISLQRAASTAFWPGLSVLSDLWQSSVLGPFGNIPTQLDFIVMILLIREVWLKICTPLIKEIISQCNLLHKPPTAMLSRRLPNTSSK